jgi:hypothetical protein
MSALEAWRLDAVSHSDRLIGVAMHQLDDANAACLLVHRVLTGAMQTMTAPATRRDLDNALGRALHHHAANDA